MRYKASGVFYRGDCYCTFPSKDNINDESARFYPIECLVTSQYDQIVDALEGAFSVTAHSKGAKGAIRGDFLHLIWSD